MSQVTVKVLYFGVVRGAVSVPDELVTLPAGGTVGDLMTALFERHGEKLREAVLAPDGSPVPNAVIVLDGRNIQHRRGMETPIERDGAAHILLMTSAVGGG
jgi:molybdopterin converting factor small subunit